MNVEQTYQAFLEATGDQRTAALLTVAAAIQESGQDTKFAVDDLRDDLGAVIMDTLGAGGQDDDDAVLEKLP